MRQAPPELRLSGEGGAIRAIFDPDYYLRQYPDVAAAGLDPLAHFLSAGGAEGRNPCALFDTKFYLERHPEAGASGLNPLVHYVSIGARRGYAPSPLFDPAWYLEQQPDPDEAARANPLAHYLSVGAAEGREPNPLFDRAWYIERCPEALAEARGALAHYAEHGAANRHAPHPLFDAAFYLQRYADVAAAGANPLADYLRRGHLEPLQPHPLFDAAWYLGEYPDVAEAKANPLVHYLREGWQQDYRPHLDFAMEDSTNPFVLHARQAQAVEDSFDAEYYLAHNPDIARAGIDAYEHFLRFGKAEGRMPAPYAKRIRRRRHKPLISIIVPNYNHARFLERRLVTIYQQTYQHIEVILLDDASTDESVDILHKFRERYAAKTRLLHSSTNSGRVFSQWQRGVSEARGELIWICESDDFADEKFLEALVHFFADPSVMVAFGRIQFVEIDGALRPGLDDYREAAEPGIWDEPQVRCAHEWFTGGFAISNLIPNVGGSLIRRQQLDEASWRAASSYRILGDWYLYVEFAQGGRIAYSPHAVSFFRQHGANTSVTSFRSKNYYDEHERIAKVLRQRWDAPTSALQRLAANVEFQFQRTGAAESIGDLRRHFDLQRILPLKRERSHILIAILGFETGGGEIFPINLANQLVATGHTVSVMCLHPERQDDRIRRRLDCRVAVYDSQLIKEIGISTFIQKAGIDLVHSHFVGVDYFFHVNDRSPIKVPYVVTLHGSYECMEIKPEALLEIVRGVNAWVYLSEKNLRPLIDFPIDRRSVVHIPNGMPIDERTFDCTRAYLGIDAEDFVFVIASRPIKQKGWEEAILALRRAQGMTNRRLRLLLCGSGPEADELKAKYASETVRFMGYQDCIVGIFKLGNCALLPSRFSGESFPLCIIEAFQAGKPVLATRIGHIPQMVEGNGLHAGILIEPEDDDGQFVIRLAEAMAKFANDTSLAASCAEQAREAGQRYDIGNVAQQYAALYNRLLQRDSLHAI